MPNSMTGFARQHLRAEWGELTCEIRSVNHRYLEPTLRLPELLRPTEAHIRDQLRAQLHRGKVEVVFHLSTKVDEHQTLSLNMNTINALAEAVSHIQGEVKNTSPLDPLRLLQWPGVIEEASPNEDAIQKSAGELLTKALQTLKTHRQREGEQLQQHIEDRLILIAEQVVLVREKLPEILQEQREKLRQRLKEFVEELDENRVEQEMVLLANKADVAEELDRLDTHLTEVRHTLTQPGAVGRRLDFMMQELNREANTLSSKSLSTTTTQAAVSIKVLIEQMREQIQNVE